jgi:hypothetical protein
MAAAGRRTFPHRVAERNRGHHSYTQARTRSPRAQTYSSVVWVLNKRNRSGLAPNTSAHALLESDISGLVIRNGGLVIIRRGTCPPVQNTRRCFRRSTSCATSHHLRPDSRSEDIPIRSPTPCATV